MKRREFLKAGAAAMAAQLGSGRFRAEEPNATVRTVYVVAMCHLDVGFTDLKRTVIETYFEHYIPTAIDTARKLKQTGAHERYVWTLSSWMLYEYLEKASAEGRKNMEQALANGDIAWHAMPFTWYSEMLDRSLMASAFNISKALDSRFGVTTVAGKLSDVPGHTRGLIGPAVEAGIQFLDIGANMRPPVVPPGPHLFRWRDLEGTEITVLYHLLNYGGIAAIPGTDVAVAVNERDDNSGPHPISEIESYYSSLRRQFPNATIVATNLNTVAKAVLASSATLPVVTQEIGDVWIYGIGSDPGKVARYRELSRLRLEWLSKGVFKPGDPVDVAFSSKLILATEHNWGIDTGVAALWKEAQKKGSHPDVLLDHPHVYTPDELARARGIYPSFKKLEASWAEKRAEIGMAVEVLPPELRSEAQQRLQSLTPVVPKIGGAAPHRAGAEIETEHFTVALDANTGAFGRLLDKRTGREWASASQPVALFRYQMFTSADCLRYVGQFSEIHPVPSWIVNGWAKPGIENYPVESRVWEPGIHAAYVEETADHHRIVLELRIPDAGAKLAELVSWPRRLTEEILLPKSSPEIQVTLSCFEKRANRLPEAMWFSFSPDAPFEQGWRFEKVDQPVSPHDVVSYGGRHLHGVTRKVTYRDSRGVFVLETLDASLVAPGQRKLTDFDNRDPEMHGGVHVNLFNNLWNTAFPQWYGDDMRFRFVMSFPGAAAHGEIL